VKRSAGLLTPWLFMAPALLVLGVFFVGSFLEVVRYSFTSYSAFAPPEWVGLDNYRRLLADDRFWTCLGNSFVYLLVTPVLVVVSLVCATLVDAGIRGSRGWRLLFFLPVVTPTIVAAVAWRIVLHEENGLINGVLTGLGLDAVNWLTERPFSLVSAMMVTLWKGFGFYMMIFLAALIAVPRDLKEAMALDGGGRWHTFLHVVLPAIWPVMTLVLIISSVSALKVFDELFVTIGGAPIEHKTVVPLVYQTAFEESAFGAASAVGVLAFVVILAFSMVNLYATSRLGAKR
jgi:putative chitobiose transport system permease protein